MAFTKRVIVFFLVFSFQNMFSQDPAHINLKRDAYYQKMSEGRSLVDQNKFKEAIFVIEEAAQIAKSNLSVENEYKQAINYLAFLYYNTDDYYKAIPLYNEVLSVIEKNETIEQSMYVDGLRSLMYLYLSIGDIELAQDLINQLLELSTKVYKDETDRHVLSLLAISDVYHATNQYESVIPIQKEIVTIYEGIYGKENNYYFNALGLLAKTYSYINNAEKSEAIVNQLISLERKLPHGSDEIHVTVLSIAGTVFQYLGKYDQAVIYLEELLSLTEQIYGKRNFIYLRNLGNLVYCYMSLGQNKEALSRTDELLKLSVDVSGENSEDYIRNLYTVGRVYESNSKFEDAAQLIQKTLVYYENNYGKENSAYLNSLITLASIYNYMEDNNELQLIDEILKINTIINKKDQFLYLSNLSKVAEIYRANAQWNKAIQIYEDLVNQYDSLYGKEHISYVLSLNSLIFSYNSFQKSDLALDKIDELLRLNDIVNKDHDFYNAQVLFTAGSVYKRQGQWDKASIYFERSSILYEKIYGNEHVTYANSLWVLAETKKLIGEYIESVQMFETIKNIYAKIYGTSHVSYLEAVNALNEVKDLLELGSKTRGSRSESVEKVTENFTYHALIIAVEKYPEDSSITSLDYPISDAKKLKTVLVNNYTFKDDNVVLMKNPTRKEIIDRFRLLTSTLSTTDHLLIFYAGHGAYDTLLETGYWKPSDATSNSDANWLSRDDIIKYLRALKTRHMLLISDACYSGSIFNYKERGEENRSEKILDEILTVKGRHAMTSALNKTVPDDSRFIKQLLKKLNTNKKDFMFATDLFNSIREAVIWNTGNNPQFAPIKDTNHEGGEFVFIKKSN